jgi:HK97 family phage prohead protease
MKPFYFQCVTKSVTRLADGKTVRIKGFASTPDLDRHEDIVLPAAFIKTLNDYKARGSAPALLRGHNTDYPCGKVIMDGADGPVITDTGLLITADVTDEQTATEAEAGEMQCFSIGYIPLQSDYVMRPTGRIEADTGQELFCEARILKELDLVEVSIVSTPANPNAVFTVTKSLTKMFNSLPHPSMKLKCDVCAKDSATARVGSRFFCKSCTEKMQFKADEIVEVKDEPETPVVPEAPKEEAPAPEAPAAPAAPAAPEEPTPPTPSSTPETPAETPEQPKPEEGAEKGATKVEGKLVISKEDKEKIIAARKKFEELDAATVADGEPEAPVPTPTPAPEEKGLEMDMKQLPSIMEKVASVLTKMSARIEALETARRLSPVVKGKTFMSFHGSMPVMKKEEGKAPEKTPKKQTGDTFLKFIQSSKAGPVTIGDEDEEE